MATVSEIYAPLVNIASTFVKSTFAHQKIVSILSHFHILLLPLFRKMFPLSRKKVNTLKKVFTILNLTFFSTESGHCFQNKYIHFLENCIHFPEKHFHFPENCLNFSDNYFHYSEKCFHSPEENNYLKKCFQYLDFGFFFSQRVATVFRKLSPLF